jgi:hypothetical protein
MFQSAAMNDTHHACKVLHTSLFMHACSIQIMLALRHDRALRYAFAIGILERLDEDKGHADLTRVVFIGEDIFHVSWKVIVTALVSGDLKSLILCWGVVVSVML